MVVVAAKTHRVANRRKLALADLTDERWVLTARDSHIRAAVNTSFVQAGLTPPTAQVETPSVIYSIAIVQAGNFITVAPPSVIRAFDSAQTAYVGSITRCKPARHHGFCAAEFCF